MTRQAAVALDTTAYLSGNYTAGYFGAKPTWGGVILHEVGHAFGLQHVAATDEIMYPAAGNGPTPMAASRVGERAGPVAVPAPQP
jgi:hypothetical protein